MGRLKGILKDEGVQPSGERGKFPRLRGQFRGRQGVIQKPCDISADKSFIWVGTLRICDPQARNRLTSSGPCEFRAAAVI